MFLELARPVAFVFCILSLYALFYAAFLNPGSEVDQKIYDALIMLAVSAEVSLVSGLIFLEPPSNTGCGSQRLSATLPVRMFCWASLTMLILFVVAWYLETGVFYRDVRVGV
jgi:hypothetical protein